MRARAYMGPRCGACAPSSIEIVRKGRLEQVSFPIPDVCAFLTEESRVDVEVNTKRDEQGSNVPDFFSRIEGLHREMRWQNELRKRTGLYWFASHLVTWKRMSFMVAVLTNLMVVLTYPLTPDRWNGLEWFIGLVMALSGTLARRCSRGRRARARARVGTDAGRVRLAKRVCGRRLLGLLLVANAVVVLFSYLGAARPEAPEGCGPAGGGAGAGRAACVRALNNRHGNRASGRAGAATREQPTMVCCYSSRARLHRSRCSCTTRRTLSYARWRWCTTRFGTRCYC